MIKSSSYVESGVETRRSSDQRCNINSSFTFRFNWAWVAFYLHFVAYGYFGAHAASVDQFGESFLTNLVQVIVIVLIQSMFGWAATRYADQFEDSFSVSLRDGVVFLSLALILGVFSFYRLKFSLFSDELSYAASAHGHSLYLSLKLAKHWVWISDVPFRYLAQLISMFLLLTICAIFYFSRQLSLSKKIYLFATLLIFCRFIYALKGGNGSPHPPLHLVLPFFGGTFLGITDFSFRFSYYLAFLGVLTLIYRMVRRKFDLQLSYLSVMVVGTMPVLLNASGVVEQSFWAFICFTLVLLELATSPKVNYIRLTAFISLMVMMRQPIFLALGPVAFHYLLSRKKDKFGVALNKQLKASACLLFFFLPFLVISLVQGTPSTAALDSGDTYGSVVRAIVDGVVWESVSSAYSFPWLMIALFAVIPYHRNLRGVNAAALLFLCSSIFIYYSIDEGLWGLTKYQLEYVAPILVLGLVFFLLTLANYRLTKFFSMLLGVSYLSLNLSTLLDQHYLRDTFTNYDRESTTDAGEFYPIKNGLVSIPYDYKGAYSFIRDEGLASSTLSIGATYGILPEVMNDYLTEEIVSASTIYRSHQLKGLKENNYKEIAQSVSGDTKIQALAIGSYGPKKELIQELIDKGWLVFGVFNNERYATSVVVIRRG